MKPDAPQSLLSEEQVAAFYHDNFVSDQVRDFVRLIMDPVSNVTDVGGGCGFFARALQGALGCNARVIDSDPESVRACQRAGVDAVCGDALNIPDSARQDVVTFNLMLHHLVASTAAGTEGLQARALAAWRDKAGIVFVNEYVYESWFGDLSGWLIYRVTSNRLVSRACRWAARYVPSLAANTFGVGVRFRSGDSWRRLFGTAGFDVVSVAQGRAEDIAPLWRLLLIRRISRDSFRLEPRKAPVEAAR